MCRIVALVNTAVPETQRALRAFRTLAGRGCVPKGQPPGHRDGWGVAAFRRGAWVTIGRSIGDAGRDSKYPAALRKLRTAQPADVIIGHLRKASIGGRTFLNTHPFIHGGYAFCHNGSVPVAMRLKLGAAWARRVRGSTDSERLFYAVLARAAKVGPRQAFLGLLRRLRASHDYTAMNILFSDGKSLWAVRDANLKHPKAEQARFDRYYTLYLGTVKGTNRVVVCSEKLGLPGIAWRAIPNGSGVEVDIRTGTVKPFRL